MDHCFDAIIKFISNLIDLMTAHDLSHINLIKSSKNLRHVDKLSDIKDMIFL